MSRVEAAAKAIAASDPRITENDAIDLSADALAAADAYDAAHNVHRVVLDDATVERAADALSEATFGSPERWRTLEQSSQDWTLSVARAVLAAAVKEER